MKRFLKALFTLIVLAGLACGGWLLYQKQQAKPASATQVQYTPIPVSTGSLSREVISTGSLTIPRTESIKAPAAVTLAEVSVRAGQQIAAGDVLATVDAASINSAVYALQTELETVDSTLVSLAASYDSQQTLTTPIAGRVKQLYAHKGDRVQDVVAEEGCLYVLSLDGKLCVEIPLSADTVPGNRLTVMNAEDKPYSGAVAAVTENAATVTFSDLAAEVGDTVTVLLSDGSTLTAPCAIHMPLQVSSTVSGVITSELLKLNKYCNKKDSAFVVSYLEPTQEYNDTLAQRQELVEQLRALKEMKAEPVIRSSTDGIINTVTAAAGQAVAKDDELFNLYVGMPDTMTVSVDELDIIHVAVGQTATVAMDAITDKTYDATVTYLSTLGTASSGITGYDVTVQLTADEQLKLGMNGTVTIAVGQQENVLLVPLTALQNDAQGSYVWLYSAEHTPTEEEPGVKTYVNTGLSNEDYAAVTGGLRAGDQVLVVRSASTAVTTDSQNSSGGMMMPGTEMQMPGEERPEGGFTRPDGSSGGGRSGSGSGSGGSTGGGGGRGGSGGSSSTGSGSGSGSGSGRTAPGGN